MAKVLVGPARELRPHFAALAAPYGFAGAQSIDGVGPKAIRENAPCGPVDTATASPGALARSRGERGET